MANDVYTMTHDGLASLVSAKAATQLLERALQIKGFRPESVSRQEMKAVLLGPVIRELEGILPKAGVERNLKRIYMSLPRSQSDVSRRARRVISSPEVRSPVFEDAEDSVEAFDIDKTEVDKAQVGAAFETSAERNLSELAMAAARVDALAATSPETASDAFSGVPKWDESGSNDWSPEPVVAAAPASPPVVPSSASPAKKRPKAAPRRLFVSSEEELGEVVLKFAKLENARMVMGMRSSGDIVLSRGSAEDLDAIARLGALGLKLLGRSGDIRSYYLAHSRSQLFLFPLGDYALTVIGTHDLNLGEVFSTLSMLEEDV